MLFFLLLLPAWAAGVVAPGMAMRSYEAALPELAGMGAAVIDAAEQRVQDEGCKGVTRPVAPPMPSGGLPVVAHTCGTEGRAVPEGEAHRRERCVAGVCHARTHNTPPPPPLACWRARWAGACVCVLVRLCAPDGRAARRMPLATLARYLRGICCRRPTEP